MEDIIVKITSEIEIKASLESIGIMSAQINKPESDINEANIISNNITATIAV